MLAKVHLRLEEHLGQVAKKPDDVMAGEDPVVGATAGVVRPSAGEQLALTPLPSRLCARSELAKVHGCRRRSVDELAAHPRERVEEARLEDAGEDHLAPVRVHHKPPDSAGEDKDFDAKVEAIEALDPALPSLLAHAPDVVAVTGDHSIPKMDDVHARWSDDGLTALLESEDGSWLAHLRVEHASLLGSHSWHPVPVVLAADSCKA